MNQLRRTSLEPLEERIAPAGLITATFVHGLLAIQGSDGADHNVSITKTGSATFRIDGNATDINASGVTSKTFHGVLRSVNIQGGAGADVFALTNLSPLKSLVFNGNAGVDSLTTSNLKTVSGGNVDIVLGSETGSVDFSGARTSLHGHLNIDLGGGGAATFASPATGISGNVAITGAGSDSLAFTGASTYLTHALTFTGGNGDASVSATGKSLQVKGLVTLNGGSGTNTFELGARTNTFGAAHTPGGVNVNMGAGPGSITFGGNSTSVAGDLKINLGSAGSSAHMDSLVTSVRDTVQVTGGAGNDILAFNGRTSIGKTLSFVGNGGNDSFAGSGPGFRVKGATSMDGSQGTNSFGFNEASLSLASLTVTGGTGKDVVNITADGHISGNVNLNLGLDGTGPSSVTLQSHAGIVNGLKLGASLNVSMPGATVDTLTIANIQIANGFTGQTGNDVSTVNISKLSTKGDFNLQTGDGADVVNLDNIASRDLTVGTGVGADVLNIDNFHVRNLSIDTGTGADVLHLERIASDAGTSRVLGTASILTGIGADQIRIGDATSAANMKVLFMGAVSLDAGDGANMINDIVASNFFKSAPSIAATGGVLTVTTSA